MIQANDLSPTLRRETVLTPLKLPESEQEQSIELDYVLPDYYPDFFRLLACTAEAFVTAEPPAEGAPSQFGHQEGAAGNADNHHSQPEGRHREKHRSLPRTAASASPA